MLNKLEKINFGKYKGRLISSLKITDPQYLIWLVEKDLIYDFSLEWQTELRKFAHENKNKIYAGSYTYLKN